MAKRIDNDKFKEIKPIIPYQRIAEKYHPVDERRQQTAKKQSTLTDRPRRRFIAMRNLIDSLKQDHSIQRIDYISAEQEIRVLGLTTIKKSLPSLLSELGLSNNATKQIITLVEEHAPLLQLRNRTSIAQLDRSLYPEVGDGLQVLNLDLAELPLPMIDFSYVALLERCKNGPITSTLNNLYLTITNLDEIATQSSPKPSCQLTLSITSGIIEIDTTGRRAFLYQRADKSFGLYSDKQINLEIW